MILAAVTLLTGCTFSKQAAIAETLARVVGRDLGYRSEQIKDMADTQSGVDPLMAANLKDLAGLLEPDAGIFNSGLDQAAADGFKDGKALYLAR